jgi:pyruvate,water dikinase
VEQPTLVDPADRGVDLREKQVLAEQELARLAPEDLRFFAAELVRLCRAYTALDDVEHYQTTRLNVPFRAALLALGGRFAAHGAVPDAEGIFFLRRKTIEDVLAGRVDAAASMSEAVDAAGKYRDQARATPPWVRGEAARTAPEGALRGLPGSPGAAEGEVFRVFSAADFPRFPPGAVLVARTTNPAWTPLFYGAAAVVTESGGPLSHGAVTAREVGIPAVMAVHGALEALPNGTRVRVNGTSGFVERL